MSKDTFIKFLSRRGYRYNTKIGSFVKNGSLVVDIGSADVTFYSFAGSGKITIGVSKTDNFSDIVKSIKTYG